MSTVIQISNLSKIYRLGEIGTGTISRDLERWYKMKIRGQEDPFLKIGETNVSNKKGVSDVVYSLRDINFEVQQGEALGIIGKNGAGKSTLLKILSRVTSPTTGKINIKGRVASLLEVGTGFHPELTGRENIYLNGAIFGMRKKEITQKLAEIINFSGVERYIDTPVKRYSSGMYVRLAFAVAAHLESEIMIVDEVLAVGDAGFQKKCLGKMGDVTHKGRTVLFVSHNMTSMVQLCQKCILLDKGKIIEIDDTKKVIGTYLSSQNNDSSGDINLTLPALRKNSLENSMFKWTRARVVNYKGKYTTSIELMEPFDIVMTGILTQHVNDLLIGFGVMSDLGIPLFNSHITDTDLPQEYSPGEITFKIRFEPNLLGPGNYLIDFGAMGLGIVDWIPEAIRINIEQISSKDEKKLRTTYDGIIIYPCKWSMERS